MEPLHLYLEVKKQLNRLILKCDHLGKNPNFKSQASKMSDKLQKLLDESEKEISEKK